MPCPISWIALLKVENSFDTPASQATSGERTLVYTPLVLSETAIEAQHESVVKKGVP